MSRPRSLGKVVGRWCEKWLVQGEGDFVGQPFVLEPWEWDFLDEVYRLDGAMRRVCTLALVIMPRGCGKTSFIGGVCLAELNGYVLVGPEGKPVRRQTPNIPVAAASWEQADELYGQARLMVDNGPLKPFIATRDTEMELNDGVGRMFRIAAVAATNEGGRPTAAGADEIHEWRSPKDRLFTVLSSSLAKRDQTLMLAITTPDDGNPDSLLGGLVARGLKLESGEVEDSSFVFRWFRADDHWDLEDPQQLRAAIRQATPSGFVDIERVAARYEREGMAEHEFRRYHLGQFAPYDEVFLEPLTWAQRAEPREVPAGTRVVLMFDGSYSGDSSALVGCTLDGYVFTVGVWEPAEQRGGEQGLVDRQAVDATVDASMKRWKVAELACDPYGWHAERDTWAGRYGDVVVDFPTNAVRRMAEACSRFYSGVQADELTHDGNPVLARHVANCVPKRTSSGTVVSKDYRGSPRLIDAAVGAIGAYDRAMWHAQYGVVRTPQIF